MIRFFLPLFLLIISSTVNAFNFNTSVGAAFNKNTVNVNVANHSCDNLGIDNEELLQRVGEAMDQFWNRAPTSRLKLQKGNLLSVDNAFKTQSLCATTNPCVVNTSLVQDQDILISCNNNTTLFSSSQLLGATLPNNVSGSAIVGAVVLLNDTAGTGLANLDRDTFIAVIAHEVGHAIGLGHSKKVENLMYYTTAPTRRTLGADDINGITYLYPAEQPEILSCGTIHNHHDDNDTNGPMSFLIGMVLILAFIKLYLKLQPRSLH